MVDKTKFIICDTQKSRGSEITLIELVKLIKLCRNRNNKLKDKLISDYEHITGEKFDYSLLDH